MSKLFERLFGVGITVIAATHILVKQEQHTNEAIEAGPSSS
jgi:hypothetical protein